MQSLTIDEKRLLVGIVACAGIMGLGVMMLYAALNEPTLIAFLKDILGFSQYIFKPDQSQLEKLFGL